MSKGMNRKPQIWFGNYRQWQIVNQILQEFLPVDHPVSYPSMSPVFVDSSKRCQVENCQNMAKIKVVQLMNFPRKYSYYICRYHFEKIFWDFVESVTKMIDETDRKRSDLCVMREGF